MKWQNPPGTDRTGRRHSVYDEVRETLMARPGDWALISEGASGSQQTYVVKRLGDGFQVVSRVSESPGKRDVYARFVGAA